MAQKAHSSRPLTYKQYVRLYRWHRTHIPQGHSRTSNVILKSWSRRRSSCFYSAADCSKKWSTKLRDLKIFPMHEKKMVISYFTTLSQPYVLLLIFFLLSWDRASLMYLSITNKMQRYTMVFIAINALHVSGGSSAHHQELKTVYTASGICRAFSASYCYHVHSTRKPVPNHSR